MVKFSELLFRINNPGAITQRTKINESVDTGDQNDLRQYFFELIEQTVATHYALSEDGDFEPTDQQLDVLECVIEFAIANRNDPDIEYIVEQLCLDESIGSAIATATHGIQNYFANRKIDKAAKNAMDAKAKVTNSYKITNTGRAKTIGGKMRVGFEKARQPKLRQKSADATTAYSTAKMRLNVSSKKRADVGNRIDAKVQSAKDSVKSAIGRGAGAVGNFAGRIASKFM